MNGSSVFGKWATVLFPYSVLLFFPFLFEENHQIEITVNPENVNKTRARLSYAYNHELDSVDLHVACAWIRQSVQACAILTPQQRNFLTSHSSATHHRWLYLYSSGHKCFTSDVSLTRTRLISRVLLTSLVVPPHTAPVSLCAIERLFNFKSAPKRHKICMYVRKTTVGSTSLLWNCKQT